MLQVTIKKKLGNFLLDVDFCMDGGVFAILGASGCGKSMTLKCIAGIERPDEGRIVLNNQLQREEELLLLPNEQVILDKRVKTMKKEWKRDGINIEWITGRLFFDEIPLPEVAQILERNYGVRIKFANDALKKIRFYGNFNKNGQSVRDILEALSATEKVHYTLNDKEIILY